jgi:hypothetical protein
LQEEFPYWLDVNGDGVISALDALAIINHLNANVHDEAEGEFPVDADLFEDDFDLVDLAVADLDDILEDLVAVPGAASR